MKTSKQIEREIHDLSQKGLDVIDGPGPFAPKKVQLDQIEKQLKDLTAERESAVFVEARTLAFHQASDPQAFRGGYAFPNAADRPTGLELGMAAFGGQITGKAAAPNITLDTDELQQIFTAAKSKSRIKLELKDTTGLVAPPVMIPGVQPFRQESQRIASILPSAAFTAASITFVRHTGNVGAAGVVLAGAEKPDISPQFESVELKPAKVAGVCTVQDELFDDFPSSAGLVSTILQQSFEAAENQQILSGTGADGQMNGLLTDPGVLTRVRGTDTALDALELAGEDLRVGPAFCEPTAYILHPTTFGAIRRTKNTLGDYILPQDVTGPAPTTLWGRPVILTTQMPAGTGIALNTELAALVYVRRGVTIDTSNAPGFTTNETTFRIEGRENVAIIRPKAIVVITGLDTAAA